MFAEPINKELLNILGEVVDMDEDGGDGEGPQVTYSGLLWYCFKEI